MKTDTQEETRQGGWMQTFTGRQFWPIDPRPDEVHIEDIAHSLSNTCRYAGHCKRFYSVAEHSVLVSQRVDPENALWALLHDASEAYLADVVKPAKRFIPGYVEAESRLMKAICERFGLPLECPEQVKAFDVAILGDELDQVMGPAPESWRLERYPLGVKIECWSPEEAKAKFLERYKNIVVPGNPDAELHQEKLRELGGYAKAIEALVEGYFQPPNIMAIRGKDWNVFVRRRGSNVDLFFDDEEPDA